MKQNSSVPKKLLFISIYFLGINGVIGSGTFLLPSVIYRYMNLTAVLILLCTALTVSMIALCYADLSSRFKESGAAWLYSYNALAASPVMSLVSLPGSWGAAPWLPKSWPC